MNHFIRKLTLLSLILSGTSANAGIFQFLERFMSERNKQNWRALRQSQTTAHGETVIVNGIAVPSSEVCTFKDISGTIPADIIDLVEQIKNPNYFISYGITPPKGILFIGAPGTGKTLMARAIAGETNSGFFHMSGSEFIELYVGVGAARVRELFAKANDFVQANPGKNAIIFIDEIDAIGGNRSGAFDHPEMRQTLNELLNQMDGFKSNPHIILIAATNTAEMLDPALKRSGRFDVHINFQLPDHASRVAILNQYIKQIPAERIDTINIEELAQLTAQCNHADLKNIANYAAKVAMREHAELVTQNHFKLAIKKIHEQRRH